MVVLYVLTGAGFAVLMPVLATIGRVMASSEALNFSNFLAEYQNFPLLAKFIGPVILGFAGYIFARLNHRRFRENAIYTQRLRQHSEELKRRNDSLTELNDALDSLVYTASHDLKTPIVNFKGLLNMLKMVKDRPGSEAMVDDIIGKLEISTDRFMDTITNLLDISRIEKVLNETPERIAIREIVEDILRDMQEQIQQSRARIEIETEAADQIMVTGQNLRSVLQNLLANAMKYTVPGREPLIRVKSVLGEGELKIEVSDNGPGIDLATNRDKIFQMFSRLSDQTTGTGVGLYIVKRTMEKIGGDVTVDSEPGRGTVFSLSFPANCIP